jgi:hypothetical protein
MTRLQLLAALLFLWTCAPAAAQNSPFVCQEIVVGQLPVYVLLQTDQQVAFAPGVPARVLVGVVVNGQNVIRNYTVGTYSGSDPCTLTTAAFTVTLSVPVTIVITDTGPGQQLNYTVTVSDFTGGFNLGAQGNLTLSLPGGTRGPIGIFASFIQIINFGTLLLSPTPAGTPLPPSIILTLTGLAGAGLLTARRRSARPIGLFHLKISKSLCPVDLIAGNFVPSGSDALLAHAIPDDPQRASILRLVAARADAGCLVTDDRVGFADGLMRS